MRPFVRTMGVLVVAAVLVLVPLPAVRVDAAGGDAVMPPQSHAFGKSLGEWTAAWWQWILPKQNAQNPVLDPTGALCGQGQSGKVWFLVGSPGNDPNNPNDTTVRSCTIPTGVAILIPIITGECSTIEAPPFFGQTDPQLRACADALLDGVDLASVKATVDGVSVPALRNQRVQSPPFDFTIPPENNYLGVSGKTGGRSVSDGFWLLLHPLSPGQHTIHVEAMVTSGDAAGFTQRITYNLTVVPGRQ